jgi:hypothetical protein
MLIFMNMRAIFLQLTATDPTRFKIKTAKQPDIFKPNTKNQNSPTSSNQTQKLHKNKLTAKHYVQPTQ